MSITVENRKITKLNGNETNFLLAAKDDVLKYSFDMLTEYKFLSTPNNPILVLDAGKVQILGSNWNEFGFEIGDEINFSAPILAGGTLNVDATVTNIQGSNLWHDGDLSAYIAQFVPGALLGQMTVTHQAVQHPTQIDIEFNLITNSSTGNQNSLIDGEVNLIRFNIASAAVTDVVQGVILGNKSGGAIFACTAKRLADVSGVKRFTIEVNFFNWLSFLEADLTTPDWYASSQSIKQFARIKAFRSLSNPNSVLSINDAPTLGSVGWYNENYNQGQNPFTVTSVVLTDDNTNVLEAIDYSQPTNIVIQIAGTGTFQTQYLAALYFVPFSDSYKNQPTSLQENTFLTLIKSTPESFGLNGGLFVVSDVVWDVSVADAAILSFKITPNAAATTYFSQINTKFYRLSITAQTTAGTATNNNRTTVLLQQKEFALAPVIGGVSSEVQSMTFYPHHLPPTGDGLKIIDLMTEDDFLAKTFIKLNKADNYDAINVAFRVRKLSNGDFFDLFWRSVSLAQFPLTVNNERLIDYFEPFNFNLPSTGRNFLEIKITGDDDATTYDVNIWHTMLVSWRYWLSQSNALADFLDISLPNNGLNNEWVRYAMSGFQFFYRVEIVKNGVANFFELPISIADYDSDIVTTEITVTDMDDAPVAGLFAGQTFKVKALHTAPFIWDTTDVWGWIAARPTEDEPRNLISTAWPWASNNLPLKPYAGETQCKISYPNPDECLLECLIDASLLTANQTIVSRVQSPRSSIMHNLDLVANVPWSTHGLGTAAEWSDFFGGATIVNFELLDDSDDYRVQMLVIGNSDTDVDLSDKNINKVNIFAVTNVVFLDLRNNLLIHLNPSIPIPITITTLALSDNNFTDYALSEPWANAQPAFTNPCTIAFNDNPVTPIGTEFETILITKNATLYF